MFIQVVQGQVSDPVEIRESFESWLRDLAPSAPGWLGSTAGVTADGTFIALVRFESPDAARRNSGRPEQHQWWMETSKLFVGGATFHDCSRVDSYLEGGSDRAGFVQIMQGRSNDPDRLWDVTKRSEQLMRQFRPEIIGGTVALHDDNQQMFTEAVYFTSESAAREGEQKTPPPELADLMGEDPGLFGDIRYYDLTEPWLHSPAR